MTRRLKWGGLGLLGALLVAQLIPMDRTNPPIESEIDVPPEVASVLRRSCFDCHSNETLWPWYSRVAPVSWFVAHDVGEGREYVNYSTWNRLSREKQAEMIHESWEHVEEGDMPPWYYLLMHRQARLSDGDRELLRSWAALQGAAGG